MASLEKSHHLGDALPPDVGSTLGRVDPPEPALAVELRQSLECGLRLGPSFECLGDVGGQLADLRALRPYLDGDGITIRKDRRTGRLRPALDQPRSAS